MADIYATLTGRTGKDRVSSEQALFFLGDVREHLILITLNQASTSKRLKPRLRSACLAGAYYDALLAHCAIKADAESIYTWDVKDFVRLGPEIADRVKTP